jgi:hypothetical protein
MKNKEVAIKTVKTATVTVMDGWNGAKLDGKFFIVSSRLKQKIYCFNNFIQFIT